MAGQITKRKDADYARDIASLKSDERSYYGEGEYYIPSQSYGKDGIAGFNTGDKIGSIPADGEPRDAWQLLSEGYDTEGNKLTRNAGSKDRVACYDFTVTAPKSVSALYALSSITGDNDITESVSRIFRSSTRSGLDLLQEKAAFGITRDKFGRTHKVAVDIIAGQFRHETSRGDDPHIHDHSLIPNLGRVRDPEAHRKLCGASDSKKLATHLCLESKFLSQWQNAAASISHVDLAWKLREMGVSIKQDGFAFEIDRMPPEMIKAWSSRKTEVETYAIAHVLGMRNKDKEDYLDAVRLICEGFDAELAPPTVRDAAVKFQQLINVEHNGSVDEYFKKHPEVWRMATLATRADKTEATGAVVQARWAKDLEALSLSPQEIIEAALDHGNTEKMVFNEAVSFENIKARASETSYVTEPQLYRFAYDEFTGHMDVQSAKDLADKFVATQMVALGEDLAKDVKIFTTQHMLDIETELLDIVATSKHKALNRSIVQNAVDKAYASGKNMTEEQRAAAEAIMLDTHTVSVLEGTAGAGKTFTVDTIVQGYRDAGYKVHGIALSWAAAGVLKEATKIEKARAVAGFINDLNSGKIVPSKNDVYFLDEGGLVGSVQSHAIAKHLHKAGAKLIISGDSLQLKPIEAGSALKAIVNEIASKRNGEGSARIDTIFRQKSAAHRQAVHDFKAGKSGAGLATYIKENKVHLAEDESAAVSAIIVDAIDYKKNNPGKTQLILATKNSTVRDINFAMQQDAVNSGKLTDGHEITGESGKATFFVGEPVQFRSNDKDDAQGNKRFTNRDLATIVAINPASKGQPGTIDLKMADGRMLTLSDKDPAFYERETGKLSMDHAYATTIYASQGQNVDRVVLFGSDRMDRSLAYVACSRHREDLQIYASSQDLANSINANGADTDWRPHSKITKSEMIGQLAAGWAVDKDLGTAIEIKRKNDALNTDALRDRYQNERKAANTLIKDQRNIATLAQLDREPEAVKSTKEAPIQPQPAPKSIFSKINVESARKVSVDDATKVVLEARTQAIARAESARIAAEQARILEQQKAAANQNKGKGPKV